MDTRPVPPRRNAGLADALGGARRFRPLRTLRFALIVAIGFTLLNFALTAGHPSWRGVAGWSRAIGTSLVFALCISFTIELLQLSGSRLLGHRMQTLAPWQRTLFHWGTPLLGLAMALPVATLLTGVGEPGADDPQLRTTPLGAAAFAVLVVSIFYGYFAIRARQLRAEQRAVQAQLKLLQGQMEPHFLFNTLANVVGLMEVDTARAKAMLESFTDYLRASLRSLREGEQTLGAELDMIDAYLRVVKVRMEDRLHYRVDIADSLRPLQLPALSLQPLVENAIRHGLEPRIEGGELRIAAHVADGALVICVTDDGLGLDAADQSTRRGTGTALNNIRERLVQAYAGRGSLRVEPAAPRGVRATLTVPLSNPLDAP